MKMKRKTTKKRNTEPEPENDQNNDNNGKKDDNNGKKGDKNGNKDDKIRPKTEPILEPENEQEPEEDEVPIISINGIAYEAKPGWIGDYKRKTLELEKINTENM